VCGLLAPLAVKNRWTLAEAAGDKTPDKMQRLLNRASWDAGGVRDDVRGYVARHLGDASGVRPALARLRRRGAAVTIYSCRARSTAAVHDLQGTAR